MIKIVLSLVFGFCLSLASSSAFAGERAYVSATGSGSLCTVVAPCSTFSAAISRAGADGEVYCLDGGFFGNFSITFSVTIMCDGRIGQAGATLNSITLPANGVAVLDGIDIDQRNFGGNSITFNGAGTLILRNSKIRNSTIGLLFAPNGAAKLVISNTTIERSRDAGLVIRPSGSGSAKVVIDGLRAEANLGGVNAEALAGTSIDLEIRNSSLSQNSNYGLVSTGAGGVSAAFIANSSISNNANIGLFSTGANSFIIASRNEINRNNIGWAFSGGGALVSYGNNTVNSLSSFGGPSATIGLQ